MSLTIASILAESAVRHADRTAVVLGELRLTYAQLWGHALQYASVLRERGVGPGDKVALLLPNTPHFPLAYFGTLALGAVAVPVHALLKAEEIQYVLEDSGAKALVCAAPLLGEGAKGAELAGVPVLAVMDGGDATLERIDTLALSAAPIPALVATEPDDTAVILYTSGTTGTPKGAEISHLNVTMNVVASAMHSFDITQDDVVLGCLPLFHTFGQTCCMNTAFYVGASVVMLPRFDGAQALELLAKEKCTIFMGVPTMYIGLLEAAKTSEHRPTLKSALSGGAALPVPVLERFAEVFGTQVLEGYGLTETSPVATFNQVGFPPKPGTVGKAIWGVEVEVARAEVDDRIELLPTGELGEIVVRGHNVFKGYLNKPDATRAAIVEGWFRTGDLGTKDADGYVSIVDRKKDMVIRGGYNIYPREVEEALLRHPAVAQVAVIGLPDPQYGEEVCAVVVRDPGGGEITEQELSAWSKTKLAAYKYPRRVIFTDAFPLGPSGKVLKRELVAQHTG
ncbi:MAG: Long-chain-fatty-acid--CoA ligase [uncultured Frankineae bacterium]|uniref:Long-chain-fatty-acid--CoA ligase n=1 Tax=uncultured Frankineae bacterium TaxID=437475 RepID=A0A6J4M4A7_9ACTN|nr:MAG: Long-chain-fatty-acid--CoA ligase [uncultured Frankineae bacterium]